MNKKTTFDMEAGHWVKGKVIHEIKKYCRQFNIKYDIDETPGFLQSFLLVTLDGEEVYVNHLLKELVRISNQT